MLYKQRNQLMQCHYNTFSFGLHKLHHCACPSLTIVLRKSPKRKEHSMPISKKCTHTIKALLLSYVLTILLLFLLAAAVYAWNLSSTFTNISIIFIYILTCFAGGLFLGKKVQSHRFLWGILLGTCYITLLMLIAIAIHHNINLTSATNITTALLCVGGGMLGGMVS